MEVLEVAADRRRWEQKAKGDVWRRMALVEDEGHLVNTGRKQALRMLGKQLKRGRE